MRKVTQQTAQAFLNHRSITVGNTHSDGHALYLHGNKIARHVPGGIQVTLAGWNTPTTRERVNGLLQLAGRDAGFCQRRFSAYLWNGCTEREIDPSDWFTFDL